MALAEKRTHKFGFTTRDEEDRCHGNIVLEHCRGKLTVGTRKDEEQGNNTGEISLKRATLDIAQRNVNCSQLFLGKSESDKQNNTACNKTGGLLSLEQISDHAYLAMRSMQQFGNREKSVSIPRSHFREGLQNIVIRRPLSRKIPEDTVSGLSLSSSLGSEYIRTTYKECDGDRDAMQVSIRSGSPSNDSEIQNKTNPRKKRPICRQGIQRPSPEKHRVKIPEISKISVFGNAGGPNVSKTETGDTVSLGTLSLQKQLTKPLPVIDTKKQESSILHHNNNSLLRKSWRLTISKAVPNSVNATDVFVSGVNIHPVSTESPKPMPTSNLSRMRDNKIDTGKPVELIQLSVPVSNGKSWRGSPVLRWDDQQQMVALGRPKSVNERTCKRPGHRFISSDNQHFIPEALAKDACKEAIKISDKNRLVQQSQKCNSVIDYSGRKEESLTNFETADYGKHARDRDSSFRESRPESSSTSPDGGGHGSTSDYAYNISPKDLAEPCLRISSMSPKMSGPSSNILEHKPSNRMDTSVQKHEKGARFRVCKPMFDIEDYEDFQHKKFKKCTGQTKYDNRPKYPTDNVHYLRVQIGEF